MRSRPIRASARPLLPLLLLLALAGCESILGSDGGARRFVDVAAADQHACALDDDGRVFCWGDNEHGALGDSTVQRSAMPVQVAGGMRFERLRSGYRTSCGLTREGGLYCWGNLLYVATREPEVWPPVVHEPTRVAEDERFEDFALSGVAACGLRADRTALCWGDPTWGVPVPNDAANEIVRTPTAVPGLRFRSLVPGLVEMCGLSKAGAAWCWGTGWRSNGADLMPAATAPGWTFEDAWFGFGASCGVTVDGRVACWGDNRWGALGVGDTVSSPEPRFVDLDGAESLAAGLRNSVAASPCVVAEEGRAFCWGHDGQGESGSEVPHETCMPVTTSGAPLPCHTAPAEVAGGHRFRRLSMGSGFTCGVTRDSRVLCWGRNELGQLGDGTHEPSPVPVEVRFP